MNILFQHHLKPASFIVNVQVSYSNIIIIDN